MKCEEQKQANQRILCNQSHIHIRVHTHTQTQIHTHTHLHLHIHNAWAAFLQNVNIKAKASVKFNETIITMMLGLRS